MTELAALEASVSRETLADLQYYLRAMLKWNPTINLIARSTVENAWERHVLDGLQVWPLAQPFQKLVDLGSGGGIPGIPLAIAAKNAGTSCEVVLIESDRRKAAFLSTICQELSLPARVLAARIEDALPQEADICTARALAPATDLLNHAERHLRTGGICLFLKGKRADEEISKAKDMWDFSLVEHPSRTDPNAKILEVGDLRRA